MMAYGLAGFLAGAVFHRRVPERRPWVLAIFGFVLIVVLIGPLLDCCTLLTVGSHLPEPLPATSTSAPADGRPGT